MTSIISSWALFREEAVLLITTLPILFKIFQSSSSGGAKIDCIYLILISAWSCFMEKRVPVSLRRNRSLGLFYGLTLAPAVMMVIAEKHAYSPNIHSPAKSIYKVQITVSTWLMLYFASALRFQTDLTQAGRYARSFLWFVVSGTIMHFVFKLYITTDTVVFLVVIVLCVKLASHCLPNCFTFGELSLLLYFVIPFLMMYQQLYSSVQLALVVNWVLFFVIAFLISLILPSVFGCLSVWLFYSLGFLLLSCLLFVLYSSLPGGFHMWVLNFVLDNWPRRQRLLILWVAEIFACAVYVTCLRPLSKKASTSERKLFHVLILLTFIPGIFLDISMLLFCSVGATCVLALLEVMRVLKMPPLSSVLNERFSVFVDPQDKGVLILTPFYLLLGQSLPIWATCFQNPSLLVGNARNIPLGIFSGVLSVGVGDTAASVIGSRFGRHKWARSNKTIEGTLSAIISQLLCIWFLRDYFHSNSVLLVILATTGVSLIEAFTCQIDNLILPIYMYFLLSNPALN